MEWTKQKKEELSFYASLMPNVFFLKFTIFSWLQLMITEKERNVETNKLMHHTLTAIDNLKHRLNGLVNNEMQFNFHSN